MILRWLIRNVILLIVVWFVGIKSNHINVDLLVSTFYDGSIPGEICELCDPAVLELLQALMKHVEIPEKITFVEEDDLFIVCFWNLEIYCIRMDDDVICEDNLVEVIEEQEEQQKERVPLSECRGGQRNGFQADGSRVSAGEA